LQFTKPCVSRGITSPGLEATNLWQERLVEDIHVVNPEHVITLLVGEPKACCAIATPNSFLLVDNRWRASSRHTKGRTPRPSIAPHQKILRTPASTSIHHDKARPSDVDVCSILCRHAVLHQEEESLGGEATILPNGRHGSGIPNITGIRDIV